MYGNLSCEGQLIDWEVVVNHHTAVPQGILDIIQSMPHDAHTRGVLVSAMSAISTFYSNANLALRGQDINRPKPVRHKQITRILGMAPTISAAAYLRMVERHLFLPASNLSYAKKFLYMLDSLGNKSYKHKTKHFAIDLEVDNGLTPWGDVKNQLKR